MCTNDHGYFLLVINTSWSFPHSWLIIGFITMLTRRVPLVEQELLSLPEHLGSHPVLWCSCYSIFSFVCMFYRSLFVLLYFFFFGHCVVCSSIYGLWLPLWYLQTLLEVITWLTVVDYLCHKWPWICSTYRKHFPVLSSFLMYHRVCTYINTTGAISGTAYPSGASDLPQFLVGFVLLDL